MDDQPSVILGLVAAKIAIAELQGSRSFKSADDAFDAMRKRLNEMTRQQQDSEKQRAALSAGKGTS